MSRTTACPRRRPLLGAAQPAEGGGRARRRTPARLCDARAVERRYRRAVAGDGGAGRPPRAIAASNCLAWPAIAVLKAGQYVAHERPAGRRRRACLSRRLRRAVIVADEPRRALIEGAGVAVPILPLDAIEADRAGAPPGWVPMRVDSESVARSSCSRADRPPAPRAR
ncbi:hypothetical protein AB5I41_08680 [Sphingomonas sp. MMS24-JH45]